MHNQTIRRAAPPLRATLMAAVALALFAGGCSSDSGSDEAVKAEAPTTTADAAPATTGSDDGDTDAPDDEEDAGEAVTVWEVPEDQMVLPATLGTDTRPSEGFEGPDGGLWLGIDEEGDDGRFGVVEPDGTERWTSDSAELAGGTFDVDEEGLAYEVDDTVTLLGPDGDVEWEVELTEGSEVTATALTESYVFVQACPSDDACGWSAIDRGEGEAGPLFTVKRSEDDATYDRAASTYAPIGEVDDTLVFVSSEAQTTLGYGLADGELAWTAREAFISPEGTLVSNGTELDPATGEEAGEYTYGGTSDTSTMLTSDSVSLVDEDDEELWSYDLEPQGTEGIVNNMDSTDDVVLVESGDELVALDRESGDVVGTVDLDEDTSHVAAAGDAFVVTLESGHQLVVSFA